MNRITANLLSDLFNRESKTRLINSDEIFIHIETCKDAEVTIKPYTPQAAAEYLRHLTGKTKSSLLQPYAIKSNIESPITIVFNGMYHDDVLQKDYNVPLLTLKYYSDSDKSSLFLDRFYQEENTEMLKHLSAPSIYQAISALTRAERKWADIEFHAQNDQAGPTLRVVN
jgi:hypothetical protein